MLTRPSWQPFTCVVQWPCFLWALLPQLITMLLVACIRTVKAAAYCSQLLTQPSGYGRYNAMLDYMEKTGIEPNATLHHFTHPQVGREQRLNSKSSNNVGQSHGRQALF